MQDCAMRRTASGMWQLVLLFSLLSSRRHVHGASVTTASWRADNITTSFSGVQYVGPWYVSFQTHSNRPIYTGDGGHISFTVNFTLYNETVYSATTGCFTLGTPAKDLTALLNGAVVSSNFSSNGTAATYLLKDFFTIDAKKDYQLSHVKKNNNTNIVSAYKATFSSPQVLYLSASMHQVGCNAARTLGEWTDYYNWVNGVVPSNSSFNVVIPANSGLIQIAQNVTVNRFTMAGGHLLLHAPGCPQGWSAAPGTFRALKCYRLEDELLDFDTAEKKCRNTGEGSIDAHLVHINDYAENDVVKRLCRGYGGVNDNARAHGCWIGLRDSTGSGNFQWIEQRAAFNGSIFRDWRRLGLNNLTIVNSQYTQGELCGSMVPTQEDPLAVEQGCWLDDGCSMTKASVCQAFSSTRRYMLNAYGKVNITSGSIEGGMLNVYQKSYLYHLSAFRAAEVHIKSTATDSEIGNVILSDGSKLQLDADTAITSSSLVSGSLHIGEAATAGIQPLLVLSSDTTLTVPTGKELLVYARAQLTGSVAVMSGASLRLNQGGDLSTAQLQLTASNSELTLGGYSSRLSTFDSFDLDVSSRGVVVGEYLNNTLKEKTDSNAGVLLGVYRLKVSSASGVTHNITQCIKYNATAEELQSKLNLLANVQRRGGVYVRRRETLTSTSVGYNYRIAFDATPTSAFAEKYVELSLHCTGITNCYCAETKVALTDYTGLRSCPKTAKSDAIDSDACVIPPNITVTRMSWLSYADMSGSGSFTFTNGTHRLPPFASLPLLIYGGTGIVSADSISWSEFAVDSTGTLLLCGKGWAAWDRSYYLFRPSWEKQRGLLSYLDQADAFAMTASTFSVGGKGKVFATSVGSTMTWATGNWSGGVIGGRATIYITERIYSYGTYNLALKYGVTLQIDSNATFAWAHGNVSLANGADVIIEGKLSVETVEEIQYFGRAMLMSSDDSYNTELLYSEPDIQWHGYFDRTLSQELSTGWYINPLCGEQCDEVNNVIVRKNGAVAVAKDAKAFFLAPIDLIDTSTMTIDETSHLTLNSGGTCGNDVVMTMNNGSILEFSGGIVSMESTCTIRGEGELLVTAGEHNLAYKIDAHITISGGAMVWPLSRGDGATISFNGGLLLNNKGKLQVQTFSTSVVVRGVVQFQDECSVQFPTTGSASTPSNFDQPDAPDPSPRGNFTVPSMMIFEGGTLQGKCTFYAMTNLFLTGGLKTIKALAKLVNIGHAEWSTGDMLMMDGADFSNRGSLQMTDGYASFNGSNIIKGTVISLDNGGDVFAEDFHSFDVDGKLDFRDYVALRTRFVNRAPVGWDQSFQQPDDEL